MRIDTNKSNLYRKIGRLLTVLIIAFSSFSSGVLSAAASPPGLNSLVGTGIAGSCTETALDTALAGGGLILFDCGPGAATIALTATKTISQDTTIDGADRITLSAAGVSPGFPLVVVNSGVTLRLRNLTLTGGNAGTGDGGALLNHGSAFLSNVSLISNQGTRGGAIYNDGALNLNGVTASGNTATRGGALYNATSPGGGAALLSSLTNVTISDNLAPLGGGGIYNDQASLAVYNGTVAGNTSDFGGASILNAGSTATTIGSVSVLNTILGPNPNSPSNCIGTITSGGFNISTDASCALSNVPSDRNTTNPLLGSLQNNGGTTETRLLNASSPAIDAGDNSNCPAVDQRGQPRPFGPGCDIGAVEVQQNYVAPTGPWYVANGGSDTNTCAHVVDPCKTINAAIAKAQDSDAINVAVGFYTSPSGDEVVNISKDLSIMGGWNSLFTAQTGLSTIQGQIKVQNPPSGQRSVTVPLGVTASLSNFILQGGGGVAYTANFLDAGQIKYSESGAMGGGLFVAGKLVASQLEVTHNRADYGGGVEVAPNGELDLYRSTVDHNDVSYTGGGINAMGGGLIVVNSTISVNGFIGVCSLCSFQGSQIDIEFGHMLIAFSTVYSEVDSSTSISAIRNNASHVGILTTLLDSPYACEQAFFNVSWGHNLENHNTCGLTDPTDQHDSEPYLGGLQNNGGLTPTHALPFYSPAVDMGYNCSAFNADQRGTVRPQGPSCDAGAYEYSGYRIGLTTKAMNGVFSLGLGTASSGSSQGVYNGIIGVLLPMGAAPSGSTFEYTPRDAPGQPLPGGMQAAVGFDIYVFSASGPIAQPQAVPTSLVRLTQPMTISLSYRGLPAGVNPSSLTLMVYDPVTRGWVDLPSVIDTAAQTVSAQTTFLGAFALAGGVRQMYLPVVNH